MNIIVTGGHLTPALAVIDYIQSHHPKDEILFCGRFYTQDAARQPSHEVDEVTRRGVQFQPFVGPKLHVGHQWWRWPGTVLSLIGATWKAWQIVGRFRPDVFLSFGGYLAVPFAFGCWLQGVPVVTHEQTRVAGSANRVISRVARKIAVSYPETMKFFPPNKTVVTGNPLRPALFKQHSAPAWIDASLLKTKPLLYITGGNQGSAVINTVVHQALKALTKNWIVIHQCGRPTDQHHYLAELEQARSKLSTTAQSRYLVKEWVSEVELSWIYHHATALVSRAGANTVQEVVAFKLPAVFIPLPFAHYDEQTLNAEAVAKTGGALVISQKELNPVSLIEAVEKIARYRSSMKAKLGSIQMPTDPDRQLYQVLLETTGG